MITVYLTYKPRFAAHDKPAAEVAGKSPKSDFYEFKWFANDFDCKHVALGLEYPYCKGPLGNCVNTSKKVPKTHLSPVSNPAGHC